MPDVNGPQLGPAPITAPVQWGGKLVGPVGTPTPTPTPVASRPDRIELQEIMNAGDRFSDALQTAEGRKTVHQRTVEVALGIPLGMVGFIVGPFVDAGRYVYKGIVGVPETDDTLAGRFVDETRTNLGKTLGPVAGGVVGLPAGAVQGTLEGLSFGASVGVNIGKVITGDKK